MYISGELPYLTSRLNQLPETTGEVAQYVSEIIDYNVRGLLTSGHLVQLDYLARLKKFQFTLSGEDLAVSLAY